MGGQSAVTVSSHIVRDNAVLKHNCASFDVEDAAALASACDIPAERAVVDHQCSRRLEQSPIQDAGGEGAALVGSCDVTAEGAVGDDQGAVIGDAATATLVRLIAAEGAIDNRQHATVADGAADFRAVVADGSVDEGQGAARAVIDTAAVTEDAIAAPNSIPSDDAVDDRQGAEAVVDAAAAVYQPSGTAEGHAGERDRNSGFGANHSGLVLLASGVNDGCLRTGTDNLQGVRDKNTLVIYRRGDEDGITRQGKENRIGDGFAGVLA